MKNNHVELFGTLTRDIEVSRNVKGNTFVKFSLACLRDGKKPWTDYINCIAFGDMANDICKHGDKDTGFCIVAIFVQALMKKMVINSIQPMLLSSLLNC